MVPSYRWKLRHREVESLAQGHTARIRQSWDLNLSHLLFKTLPLTTALWLAKLIPSPA